MLKRVRLIESKEVKKKEEEEEKNCCFSNSTPTGKMADCPSIRPNEFVNKSPLEELKVTALGCCYIWYFVFKLKTPTFLLFHTR